MAQQELTVLTLKDILLKARRWMEILIEDGSTSEPDRIEATSDFAAINAVLASMDAESENVFVISDIPYHRLSNLAYARLIDLLEHGTVNHEHIDLEDVLEANLLLDFKKAIAMKVDSVVIRFKTEEDDGVTSGTQGPAGQ